MSGARQSEGTQRAAARVKLTGMIGGMLALVLTHTIAMATVEQGPVVNLANGHNYYLLSPNTWTGAEAEARTLGGDLVAINDGAENNWVWETFSGHGPLWIGLSDAARDGEFVFPGGATAPYFNWWVRSPTDYEPNNIGVEHYVEMNNYVWNNNIDGRAFHAVVEVGTTVTPPQAPIVVITPPAPIIVTAVPVVVNNGAGNQADPHVDGNLVSYTSALNISGEIRYFDFATGVDLGIPVAAPALDYLSDVNGATVVFTRVELAKQSIWSFDTTTAGPAVELAPHPASLRRGAAVGGGTVAWQDMTFSTDTKVLSEIVVYDLPTGATSRLTTDNEIDRVVAVALGGNVVVWERCATASSPCDIWKAVKDAYGWTASQVTNTPDPETYSDTNGTLVVYGSKRAGNATGLDIYWTPVASGAESQLALVGEQRNPNISGNFIAFEGANGADPSPNWDIYLYDLSAMRLYKLTDTPALNEILNDISVVGTQVRVVWSVTETDLNVYGSTFYLPVANAGAGQTVHVGRIVTLDGSASSDQDRNYPLVYAWTITAKPAGSTATLTDPAVVNPSFTADLPGDYVVRLVVTDSSGFVSAASLVTISTTNTAPVAAAGPDQAITLIGSTVHLDGSTSYDLEGDPLTYAWTIVQKPVGSAAMLSNPAAIKPTFTVDVYGDYVIALVVSDPWTSSAADIITASFYNIKPIAAAGGNQSVVVGDTVQLNGGGSSDANGDALTYIWSFASKPAGSGAALATAFATASFVADLPGSYVVSLVVNDGLVDSDPANVSIAATGGTGSVLSALARAINTINLLAPASFKNATMANALTNKINAAIQMIDQGLYRDALDKLQNDIVAKTDGCANALAPDKNDWITTCSAQRQVYPLLIVAIDQLKLL